MSFLCRYLKFKMITSDPIKSQLLTLQMHGLIKYEVRVLGSLKQLNLCVGDLLWGLPVTMETPGNKK